MTVSVFARGNQFLRQGKLEEAIASFQLAIELNPQFAWSYQNLGDALEKVGLWRVVVALDGKIVDSDEVNSNLISNHWEGSAVRSKKSLLNSVTLFA